MRQEELVGKVKTVLGLVEPESLGITLSHEHLLTDLWCYFIEPAQAREKKRAHEPVSLENLWWVKPHCLTSWDDLKMTDEQVAMILGNGGFEVVDLGVDISAGKFVKAIENEKPSVLGLPSLLTITMPRMKDVIKALIDSGLREKVKVIVGGVPILKHLLTRLVQIDVFQMQFPRLARLNDC